MIKLKVWDDCRRLDLLIEYGLEPAAQASLVALQRDRWASHLVVPKPTKLNCGGTSIK